MKKTLKKLVVTALATNMALVALPVASVWAQDAEETTEEVSEETTEDAQAEAGHPLAGVLTEASAENLALLDAYDAYQQALSQFTVQDVAVGDVNGTSYQEVVDSFETSVEGEEFELSETEKYLSYTFEIDEVSEATGENKASELILYFSNDTLMYIGIATLDMEIYPEDVLAEDEIETWIADQVNVQTVADRQTRIMGLSEMVYEGVTYHMVFLPTISGEDEIFGDYMIISEDAVYDSYPLGIEEAIESPQTTMLNLFSNFFGFSEEEAPAEEETTEETSDEVPAEEETTEETTEEETTEEETTEEESAE
ncbi:hypothetical protein ACTQ5J_08240 [Fundicoccus sp. Sow4_F4]|uniref:hypothetical protein n=1 Tax=Fundicoccus sp. Sow4_F4 TaxID=3438783 RepID=UPI003F8DB100